MKADDINLTAWVHRELPLEDEVEIEALLADPDFAVSADEHAGFCSTLERTLAADEFELSPEERARVLAAFAAPPPVSTWEKWLRPTLAAAAGLVAGAALMLWVSRPHRDDAGVRGDLAEMERRGAEANDEMKAELRRIAEQGRTALTQLASEHERLAALEERMTGLEERLKESSAPHSVATPAPGMLVASVPSEPAETTNLPENLPQPPAQTPAATAATPTLRVDPTLPAPLRVPAAKYAQDRAALNTAREKEFEPWRSRYLKVLLDAQAAGTNAARSTAAVAQADEIQALKSGSIPAEIPVDFPRSLVPARKEFQTGVQTLDRAVAARVKDLDVRYLQTLAALDRQATSTRDTALTAAIATEREHMANVLSADAAVPLHRNVVINGKFSEVEPSGLPKGWKPRGENWHGENLPWANDATVVQEGAEKFLRFRRTQSIRLANMTPSASINIPPRARAVAVSVKMRVEGLVPAKGYDVYPGLSIRAYDANGSSPGTDKLETTENTRWRKFSKKVALPPGAKTLGIIIGPWAAMGTCDFDDVDVEFE
jgi:hypothetical protein